MFISNSDYERYLEGLDAAKTLIRSCDMSGRNVYFSHIRSMCADHEAIEQALRFAQEQGVQVNNVPPEYVRYSGHPGY